jgi:hypothetical protein
VPFSRLASSFSTDIAVGELVEAGGKSRVEGQAWGKAGDKVSKKGRYKSSSRYLNDG